MSVEVGADIKIIVVGDLSTGKTSFVHQWASGYFQELTKATISSNYEYKISKIKDTIYRIQAWDLPGQDRDYIITKLFSKNCHGVLIVCEKDNIQSFKSVLKWKKVVEENVNNIPFLLVENKWDLIEEDKQNEGMEEMQKFAEDNGFIGYYRTSAKTGQNVERAMNKIIGSIINEELSILHKERADTIHLKKATSSENINNITTNDEERGEKKTRCC